MIPFIKDYFNASWVVAHQQSFVVRDGSGKSSPKGCEPVVWAHLDFAPIAGPMFAALVDQSEGVPTRPYSRLMIAQTWHALSPPPQDCPLAFCDGASVHDTDSVVVNYRFFNTTTKLSVMHFNPAQRWYYFPEMTADEFILFKGYDSEVCCNAKAAHAAFDNRRAYPNAKPRVSVEGRFLVYFA
ncbi:CmcJ/NvfI family oxidoreductase [Bradyrhizobium cytisi]|uniref:Methyltransferase n=1 Tax=Bradyrhizobium cytisi TaxID=515489 RepID=A0A5S4VUI6_9BRAD|nr:CmcJ/NvfI family oxidoreductase [Bradyrhizobium cytisi]TYL69985.1 hypothetical protein FXB38_42145 [Bradyrhizobium cytisi]